MNQLPRPGQTDLVLLSEEDRVAEIMRKVIENLWESVNELTRLRTTHKQNYFVTIFGSARIAAGSETYGLVKELATKLTAMECGIITGGGPGLMQAANEGASGGERASERSLGFHIELPFEQGANPFVGRAFSHKTFFSRLHHFVVASDAFIVVPGGIGTLLELSMVWQLLQVRKLYDTPLILVGEMWPELVKWAKEYMCADDMRLASEIDFQIPICVKTTDEAIKIVEEHKSRWAKVHVKKITEVTEESP